MSQVKDKLLRRLDRRRRLHEDLVSVVVGVWAWCKLCVPFRERHMSQSP